MACDKFVYAESTFKHQDKSPVNQWQQIWQIADIEHQDIIRINAVSVDSIDDRTPNLNENTNGPLTVYFHYGSPENDMPPKWQPMPVPKDPFYVILPMYEPKAEMLYGNGTMPPIRLAN